MVGTSPEKRKQPTISRFFQKTVKKVAESVSKSSPVSTIPLSKDTVIEILSSEDEDCNEISAVSNPQIPSHQLIIKSETPRSASPTQDSITHADSYREQTTLISNSAQPSASSLTPNQRQITETTSISISNPSQTTHDKFGYNRNCEPAEFTPSEEQITLRNTFKRKLNGFFKDQNQANNLGGNEQEEEEEDLENIEEEEISKPAKKAKKVKLTPLDQQVKELKLKHPDKILAIQVGYKYKFYCQDAVIVHKVLNIRLVPGKINIENETPKDLEYNKLAYCSIPEPRLHIHLQRLLDKGLKVGVVQQMEASSIHNMENSSGSLIERSMTNIFTKATYLEYDPKGNQGIKDDKSMDSLMVIIERSISPILSKFTVVAVQPLTGDIIFDEFQDTFLRNELDTRLSHLEPIELLYFKNNFTQTTSNLLKHFMNKNSSTNIRTAIYDHDVDFKKFQRSFNEFINTTMEEGDENLTGFLMEKNEDFQVACTMLYQYLEEYGLNSSFKMREKYAAFIEANHMILNADTIENLEIFHNNFNGTVHGSLMWLLDHTRTKFGYRKLKQWVVKPLIDRELIEKRFDAITELTSGFSHFLESFTNMLKNCPDLDKILNRLHYGKIKRKELYVFLNIFNDFEALLKKFGNEDLLKFLKSGFLVEVFGKLIDLSKKLKSTYYTKLINPQIALDDSFSKSEEHILKYFNLNQLQQLTDIDQSELTDIIENIENIEQQLKEELNAAKVLLKRPALEFIEKSREPYLIEVRQALVKNLPSDWVKINSTKMVARFRPPKVNDLYKKIQYYQELYLKQMNYIFSQFVSYVNKNHYLQFNEFIQTLATFDCLLSLSITSLKPDHCKPEFIDTKSIVLKDSRNPIIETLNPNYTSNDITMDQSTSCFVITGPNMGGKSSIVKQIALIAIMAQIGCYVSAKHAKLGIFNSILIRMGSFDNLIKGESTFFVEMSQVLNILNELDRTNGNALVILDEVGRGTSTVDGIAIAQSIVEYILQAPALSQKALTLFITHFPSIGKLSSKYPALKNYHMSFMEEKSTEDNPWPKVTFLYKFIEGIVTSSYGLNVAKLASIDEEILKKAYEVSKQRESEVEERRLVKETKRFLGALKSGMVPDDAVNILSNIDFN